MALTGLRALLHFMEYRNLRIGRERIRNLMIVGSVTEAKRVEGLLIHAGIRKNLVHIAETVERLDELVRIFKVEELIFCSKDIRSRDILSWMTRLGPYISYKIVPEESMSIIGSSSKDEPGELYTIDIRYAIAQPRQQRSKRLFDIGICVVLAVTLPVWLLFSKHRKSFANGWLAVATGQKSWVGYAPHSDNKNLPGIKSGVFTPFEKLRGITATDEITGRLNFLYARDWTEWSDLEIIAG
jgi:hypothetical protein